MINHNIEQITISFLYVNINKCKYLYYPLGGINPTDLLVKTT